MLAAVMSGFRWCMTQVLLQWGYKGGTRWNVEATGEASKTRPSRCVIPRNSSGMRNTSGCLVLTTLRFGRGVSCKTWRGYAGPFQEEVVGDGDQFWFQTEEKGSLGKWFSPCENIGIAAEHGYFLKWPGNKEWETCGQSCDFGWMQIVEPGCGFWLWFFASKGNVEHLESVLANEPVAVKSGHYIVEVKPQGVSKGSVAEKIFHQWMTKGKPVDFVLCIGDDRSDEDMFEAIGNAMSKRLLCDNALVFACTVGQKQARLNIIWTILWK
ncbi:Trehalose-phosphatase protein [Raphanus sativus]|nr:Trehalose-phosphatase protein [Raphanus sativus]